MKTRISSSSFLSCIVILCIVLILRSDPAFSSNILGISPQYKALWFTSSASVKCRDGSNIFTESQLNDDFCDCTDGTDEPGTSACPNGKFYCLNAGHVPLSIFSSRVNDGICDCCDGSDEYDGKTKCSNTCWEAGKVARDKLTKKVATYKEGVIVRKKEIENAKVAVAKDEAELFKLKNEEKRLKGLVRQLKEQKELIEKAEEKERLQKEKEEKAKKEAEDTKKKESETDSKEEPVVDVTDEKFGLVVDPPSHQDALTKELKSLVAHESDTGTRSKDYDVSKQTGSLPKEELSRLIASRWTGEDAEKQDTEDAIKSGHYESSAESPKDVDSEQHEEYDNSHGYDNEEEEEEEDGLVEDLGKENYEDSSSSYQSVTEDDLDLSDLNVPTSNLSWLEKIQHSMRNILQVVNLFQPRVNMSGAAHVRKEYDESSSKLSNIQARISSLTIKLKQDFGPDKEYFSFYEKCFEMKENKYIYKVCPYKEATQEEGYSETCLGNWDKFEDSYRVMVFSSGDNCWNGPDRSLKVKLSCGLENELTNVEEPSRCEYVAHLGTPVLCAEEKLKELEDNLEPMIKQRPQCEHDEL